MQIFILGRTLAEQYRFAQIAQERLGGESEEFPVFSAVSLGRAFPKSEENFRDLPLSTYGEEPEDAVHYDIAAAFRQWQKLTAADNCLIVGAGAPDVFIKLFGLGEGCALVWLDSSEDAPPLTGRETAAQTSIDAYLDWVETHRAVPTYEVTPEEFEALTVTGMYEGPSEAFFQLWAA